MTYPQLQILRSKIMEEITSEFPGIPLSIEHRKLAEMRLANALAAGVLYKDLLDTTNATIKKNLDKLMAERV